MLMLSILSAGLRRGGGAVHLFFFALWLVHGCSLFPGSSWQSFLRVMDVSADDGRPFVLFI